MAAVALRVVVLDRIAGFRALQIDAPNGGGLEMAAVALRVVVLDRIAGFRALQIDASNCRRRRR
jgi:hypothetical protein